MTRPSPQLRCERNLTLYSLRKSFRSVERFKVSVASATQLKEMIWCDKTMQRIVITTPAMFQKWNQFLEWQSIDIVLSSKKGMETKTTFVATYSKVGFYKLRGTFISILIWTVFKRPRLRECLYKTGFTVFLRCDLRERLKERSQLYWSKTLIVKTFHRTQEVF